MRGILDALDQDGVIEVTLVKSVQVGGSELAKTAIGFWVDNYSDNVLLVLPNQKTAEEHLTERILPMLQEPRLSRYFTGQSKHVRKGQVDLVHCTVYLGWTGSPQSLASRAIRFAVYDETDKGSDHSKEAATADLIRDRLTTYLARARYFQLSTPTTRDGHIWQAWINTPDQRRFNVPCPHCGAAQPLEWERLRWEGKHIDDDEQCLLIADELLSGQRKAWYSCAHCEGDIHEKDRLKMVNAGDWVSSLGDDTQSARVAFHISALYSPWVTFARTVVEYLRGKAAHDLRNFYNSFLGLPHEEVTGSPQADTLRERSDHPANIVPRWATALTVGADTQAENGRPYWYWVIRAWGKGNRSRLVSWGRSYSVKDLKDATINQAFPVEGGGMLRPLLMCVDSGGAVDLEDRDGNTTDLVYRMARDDPHRIVPIKGAGRGKRRDKWISSSNVDYQPPGEPQTTVLLHTLDVESLKDQIASTIRRTDPVLWEESEAADNTYLSHMTSEEKTRVKKGTKTEICWVRVSRRRNDLWDATVYCYAAARILRVGKRKDYDRREKEDQRQRAQAPRQPEPQRRQQGGGYNRRGGSWISRR